MKRKINNLQNESEKINELLDNIRKVSDALPCYGLQTNLDIQKSELSERYDEICIELNNREDCLDVLESEFETDMLYISSVVYFIYKCYETVDIIDFEEEYLKYYQKECLYICFSKEKIGVNILERISTELWAKIEELLYKKYEVKIVEQLMGPIYKELNIYRDWQTKFDYSLSTQNYFKALE